MTEPERPPYGPESDQTPWFCARGWPHVPLVAQRVREGEASAVSYAEDAVARREARPLDAYACFDAVGAVRQAHAVDAQIAKGRAGILPLAGVTVSAKDLYGVEGMPIRAGSKRELPERWQREGPLVKALRQAGAVIVGKTHTVEFAFGGVGLNPVAGTPLNPWDSSQHRVPGGSSSGAGASLWEGSAQLALGSDTGGSIRIPASATGVVGFRPTTGRWPTDGVVPLSSTLDTVGLLSRTALDLRYAFAIVEWLMSHEGRPLGESPVRMEDLLFKDAPVRWLRIGVPKSYTWDDADSGVAATVREALKKLERAGATLVDLDVPEFDQAGTDYLAGSIVAPECIEFLERELPDWASDLDPVIAKRLEIGRHTSATEYLRVQRRRHALSAKVHERMEAERVDVLALPTLPITPPTVASLADLDAYREANHRMLSGTSPASMLDMCAISLPAGLDPSRMPAGLQLVGRKDDDLRLLDIALEVQERLGKYPHDLPPRVEGL